MPRNNQVNRCRSNSQRSHGQENKPNRSNESNLNLNPSQLLKAILKIKDAKHNETKVEAALEIDGEEVKEFRDGNPKELLIK